MIVRPRLHVHRPLTVSYPDLLAVEEWQRRQRAEKEKERQQKQASAEILSGYRASELSADALKLKELRERERLQRQQAEETLRNFKKLEEPLHKAKTVSQPQAAYPTPVNAGGGSGQEEVAFGSVEAMKANFDDSSSHYVDFMTSSGGMANGVPMNNGGPPVADSKVALASETPSPSFIPDNATDEAAVFAPTGAESTTTIPSEKKFTTNDTLMESAPALAPPVALPTETPIVPLPAPTTVAFSFGVITDKNDKVALTTAYQQGLERVLQQSDISFRSVTRDMSFTGASPSIVRYVLTAVVPTDQAAAAVYETVGRAIQGGQLLDYSRQ